ncbi:exodeoxyribonuclease VII large subunit [Hahella sp. CR1]|uniref:exodeoxyribonuclease VII large subunit n=1 Tax=Hahella sp. CR1 TaxID=2992807 RepID=UPI00244340A9|nr:exodeoxyribonuclease VII large subunit [Hahella sp. CR1]MDG9668543.1 exodeoxyribonuclease VII large subunit [Hahella sp. CR1]
MSELSPHSPLSVSELNRQVRRLLEVSFMQVWVTGEISNFSCPSSGHWYFSLKDDKAQVRCAMFRNRNMFVKQRPRDGEAVTLRAKVSLYEGRGEFQLIAEGMELAGEGELRRAFEELKLKLSREGLFEESRKRPLPAMPKQVGVITSPTGAAVRDILTVLKRRFPAIPVLLFPVPVQGKEAGPAIVAAIASANRLNACDVLIVGRGGGSLEDLWAFNEEPVARAIAASAIPIVSAVGHETDITIADLVADLRAPTPSAAAEKVSPDQAEWKHRFLVYEQRLGAAAQRLLRQEGMRLNQLRERLKHPGRRLQESAQRLDDLEMRLHRQAQNLLSARRNQLMHLHDRLLASSPKQSLKNRYATVDALDHRLQTAVLSVLRHKSQHFAKLCGHMEAVSPIATLARGYAIVSDENGQIIRSEKEVRTGQKVKARLSDGEIHCEVIAPA